MVTSNNTRGSHKISRFKSVVNINFLSATKHPLVRWSPCLVWCQKIGYKLVRYRYYFANLSAHNPLSFSRIACIGDHIMHLSRTATMIVFDTDNWGLPLDQGGPSYYYRWQACHGGHWHPRACTGWYLGVRQRNMDSKLQRGPSAAANRHVLSFRNMYSKLNYLKEKYVSIWFSSRLNILRFTMLHVSALSCYMLQLPTLHLHIAFQ